MKAIILILQHCKSKQLDLCIYLPFFFFWHLEQWLNSSLWNVKRKKKNWFSMSCSKNYRGFKSLHAPLKNLPQVVILLFFLKMQNSIHSKMLIKYFTAGCHLKLNPRLFIAHNEVKRKLELHSNISLIIFFSFKNHCIVWKSREILRI